MKINVNTADIELLTGISAPMAYELERNPEYQLTTPERHICRIIISLNEDCEPRAQYWLNELSAYNAAE